MRILKFILIMITMHISFCSLAQENPTTVITSFYPMYIMTINILQNIPNINVVNLTKPQTGCLHDYQLTPADVKTLETGNIFIVNGAGMENFLSKVIKQYPKLKMITATEGIELLKNNDHANESNHHHDHSNSNPHVWVSVSLAIKQVGHISNELQTLLPNYKSKIIANTENYVNKLTQLKKKMHQIIDPLKHRDIVTFHEAFPYFAKEFNLNIVDVIEREPGSEPSAQELVKVIEKIKKLNVIALFAEPQYSSKAAQTIANETSSKVYYLDPAVTGPLTKDAYIKTMENNLLVLETALK